MNVNAMNALPGFLDTLGLEEEPMGIFYTEDKPAEGLERRIETISNGSDSALDQCCPTVNHAWQNIGAGLRCDCQNV